MVPAKAVQLKVKCQGHFKVPDRGHMKVKHFIFSIISTKA